MRHRVKGKKLRRDTAHRRALLRNLVTSFLEKERIRTSLAKAKASRPLAEKMITLGKRDTLHARRQAERFIFRKAVLKKLFDELGPLLVAKEKEPKMAMSAPRGRTLI